MGIEDRNPQCVKRWKQSSILFSKNLYINKEHDHCHKIASANGDEDIPIARWYGKVGGCEL